MIPVSQVRYLLLLFQANPWIEVSFWGHFPKKWEPALAVPPFRRTMTLTVLRLIWVIQHFLDTHLDTVTLIFRHSCTFLYVPVIFKINPVGFFRLGHYSAENFQIELFSSKMNFHF
jgi:hypothetical protein